VSIDPWTVAAAAAAAFIIIPRLLGARRVPTNIVKERLQAGAKIVDVRTVDEFRTGAYPGAVNIPLQLLSSRLNEIPRDRPVVLYCASGMRSASAAKLLKQAGYGEVVNAGGLRDMPVSGG